MATEDDNGLCPEAGKVGRGNVGMWWPSTVTTTTLLRTGLLWERSTSRVTARMEGSGEWSAAEVDITRSSDEEENKL